MPLRATDSDAILRVQFASPAQGGRSRPVGETERWEFYSCPLFVTDVNHGFDVRMHSSVHPLLFGRSYEVEADFLSPDEASMYFVRGKTFTMWEGRTIGFGEVLETNWRL
jgi:hypothetical protein